MEAHKLSLLQTALSEKITPDLVTAAREELEKEITDRAILRNERRTLGCTINATEQLQEKQETHGIASLKAALVYMKKLRSGTALHLEEIAQDTYGVPHDTRRLFLIKLSRLQITEVFTPPERKDKGGKGRRSLKEEMEDDVQQVRALLALERKLARSDNEMREAS
ncbi:MAG: hypothetical protein Q7R81_01355 [Candidatus Peregrinibacteria bacterium]|nr:hypothetical protein [Candidatus Peregrinibacteria bacterium]